MHHMGLPLGLAKKYEPVVTRFVVCCALQAALQVKNKAVGKKARDEQLVAS